MTSIQQRLWLLRKTPQLGRLNPDILRQLALDADVLNLQPRDHAYLEGDPSEHVFLVHGGRLKTYRVTQGHSLTLGLYRAGGSFGELALGGEQSRADSAVALKTSQLTRIPRGLLLALVRSCGELAACLIALLGSQRRSLEDRVVGMCRKADARVAELLLALVERDGSLGLPHSELAEMAGLRRETMSLVLSKLHRKGLVCRDGRRIVVADFPGLCVVAGCSLERILEQRTARTDVQTLDEGGAT